MKVVKHAEGVYEIEEFLNEEDRIVLLSKAIVDVGWNTENTGNTVKDVGEKLYPKMQNICKNIEIFFTNIKSLSDIYYLRRLRNSEFMWPHTDGGYPDDPRKIMFGIAIYLNNDFHGGELIYPDLGLSITPKVGSMVIHSAHLKHQVFPVTTGERYSVTCFVFGDDSTKINMIF
jgi:predicted 2-oxoglutarate/Fe(II)-dependent dioxygenase YbiX